MDASKADTVHVAVGIVYNAFDEVLIARRLPHKHQGDTWEFPGGKIEAGETAENALKRELYEEVGITVQNAEFWFEIPYTYPEKKVHLLIYKVDLFSGEPQGLEGQTIQWIKPQFLRDLRFPQANHPIVERLHAENTHLADR